MNTFSGKGKVGFLAVFAVLLMPLLGVGTASAFEVGDKVDVLVPDLQEFADSPETQQFTVRAITSNAVWLVQDVSYVDNEGGFDDTTFVPKDVWGDDPLLNMVSPASFTELTEVFETEVWSTIVSMFGTPIDINGDGKIAIVLASIPTKYSVDPNTNSPRRNMYYVDHEFYEIEGEEMEVMYINIHSFTRNPNLMPGAEDLRKWSLANGLAYMGMLDNDPLEEPWVLRGLSEVAQYEVFGFTYGKIGALRYGHGGLLYSFRLTPYLDLTLPTAGPQGDNYSNSRAQQFLFFMYMIQREGEGILADIAQNELLQGMASVAYAIDPTYDPETAVNDLVVPLYYDWLICNLHNDYRSDFAGGIYKYDFLEGVEDFEDWAHAGMGAAFSLSVNQYPIEGLIPLPTYAMDAPVWAAQYCRFLDYDQEWTTYFNGQYTDGRGSKNPINSRWEGIVITCDDDAMEFDAVTVMEFDDLYNTEFTLASENTYIIVTNNNPGGATGMRYYISNDDTPPQTETAIHQNSVMTQYITVYTALFDNEEEAMAGYDWVGPIFEATLGDSTRNIKMTPFFSTVWTSVFQAWNSGTYSLSFAGYDSSGNYVQGLKDVAVGFADVDLTLELDYASLHVPRGGAPSGAMVTLAETDALGMALETSAPIGTVRGRMTGVVAGPVTIPDVNGTLSFASATDQASIYRYTEDAWVKLDSWMQNGKISAAVEEGGIYALGEGIGVFAPELPAQLVLGANAPNPFSAQTAISFGLPVEGNVRVNVFDMSGRLVNTLANEEMAAANHTLIWDGTDMNGNTVGTGVYFCRLEAAGQVLTQKMLKVQ